jgi:hypothetical protein
MSANDPSGHCRGNAGCGSPLSLSRPFRGLFPFTRTTPIPHRRFPPPWSGDVVWLKGNAHKKFALSHSQVAHRPDFSHGPTASCVAVTGDGRARDDKPTAQTTRCCIFGGLSPHRRNCRNRYIDSSKSGTNPAGTVVRGAPALAAGRDPLIFLVPQRDDRVGLKSLRP